MKRLLYLALLLIVPLFVDAKGPNFVFFLVDDLGWADVGCNGSTFHKTPHIDALAKSGVRFTDGYAAASVCSPTRASILTGRHPVRVNVTDWIPGTSSGGKYQKVEDRDNLALDEVTIAEVLKENGYRTFFDLLQSPEQKKMRSLYWHYPHYHGSGWTPGGAIRKGDWKLIEFWEYGDSQLYDLATDIGELNDLSESRPDVKNELTADLAKWRKEIGAVMPELSK